jgi:predicted RNase H-like HicB family nuclease
VQDKAMQHIIHAIVRKGDTRYVAECVNLSVVTQGKTLDETAAGLQEAVALHLKGENPADFNLAPNPTLTFAFPR